MIDDVKPSSESSNSLRAKLDALDVKNKQTDIYPSVSEVNADPMLSSQSKVDFSIDELSMDEGEEKNSPPPEPSKLSPSPKPNKNWKEKFKFTWPPGKKEWISSALFIVVCGVIVAFVLMHTSGPKPVASAAPKIIHKPQAPKSTLVASTLSGLPVAPNLNKQPVTGVMIENTDFARPQSGLSQAGVVFEAIAEGGITRFLALYQDSAPTSVGPIRSVRPYYEQWALGFDAAIAHVGGSPEGLQDMQTWGVKDLNEFYNAGYYHRISSRAAPHNMYSSIVDLQQLESKKNYTSVNFTGFPRKADSPSKTPNAKTINMNISWSDYAVHYDYDSATNSYNRSEGGAPMVDANTGAQLSPKVVVAMVVPLSSGALDTTGAYYSDYQVVGSGQAYIFQDGTVTPATWTKTNAASQIAFTDASGKQIKLNAGQTWITALSSANLVSYSP